MNSTFLKLLFFIAFFVCGNIVNAQLPNEKFGKPSNMEWEFNGWGDAVNADAIILCKTMTVTYQLSDQVSNFDESDGEIGYDNLTNFGKNQIDDSNILVKYEVRLRTKILKPEGAKHANLDITYYDATDNLSMIADDLSDFKITVFTKNDKGKVEKRNVNTNSFVKERVDDNYMVMHVIVPDVQAGSIIEYKYNITSTRAAYLYDWVFQECIPTVRSKCDIDVPAILQFNMNAPINKLIKSSVEVGQLAYDSNRADLKRGKSCPTNHYKIVGDYILPEDYAQTNENNTDDKNNATDNKIANFTSQLTKPEVTPPANMPEGYTHLKIK